MYTPSLRSTSLSLVIALSSAGAGQAESYPLTIENCGHTTTFDAAPERAVSIGQGTTEILLSLGLEDKIVGTAI